MGVKVKSVSDDRRNIVLELPFRWYSKNLHGTMFGGFIAAVADPVPAITCAEVFPGLEVWTKKVAVDFLKPGRGPLQLKFEISDSDYRTIAAGLAASGKVRHEFEFFFWDRNHAKVAHVINTVHLRQRK